MNEHSSRSHSILTLYLESRIGGDSDDSNATVRMAKLHLVDLAGSERLSLSGAEGATMRETQNINLSLSVLGDVLSSLSKKHTSRPSPPSPLSDAGANANALSSSSHTAMAPYRNSKLTHLLKDSLGGNSKTVMITTIRASSVYYQQTRMSLLYASRAKHIRNRSKLNVDTEGESNIRQVSSDIEALKKRLGARKEEFERLVRVQANGSEENAQLRRRLTEMRTANVDEKRQLEQSLQSVIHSQTSQLSTHMAAYSRMHSSLEEYQAVCARQQVEIDRLRKSVTKKEALSKELAEALTVSKNDSRVAIGRQQVASQALASTSQQLRVVVSSWEQQKHETRIFADNQSRIIADLTARLARVKKEQDADRARNGAVQAERLQAECRKFTDLQSKMQEENDALRAQVSHLEGDRASTVGERERETAAAAVHRAAKARADGLLRASEEALQDAVAGWDAKERSLREALETAEADRQRALDDAQKLCDVVEAAEHRVKGASADETRLQADVRAALDRQRELEGANAELTRMRNEQREQQGRQEEDWETERAALQQRLENVEHLREALSRTETNLAEARLGAAKDAAARRVRGATHGWSILTLGLVGNARVVDQYQRQKRSIGFLLDRQVSVAAEAGKADRTRSVAALEKAMATVEMMKGHIQQQQDELGEVREQASQAEAGQAQKRVEMGRLQEEAAAMSATLAAVQGASQDKDRAAEEATQDALGRAAASRAAAETAEAELGLARAREEKQRQRWEAVVEEKDALLAAATARAVAVHSDATEQHTEALEEAKRAAQMASMEAAALRSEMVASTQQHDEARIQVDELRIELVSLNHLNIDIVEMRKRYVVLQEEHAVHTATHVEERAKHTEHVKEMRQQMDDHGNTRAEEALVAARAEAEEERRTTLKELQARHGEALAQMQVHHAGALRSAHEMGEAATLAAMQDAATKAAAAVQSARRATEEAVSGREEDSRAAAAQLGEMEERHARAMQGTAARVAEEIRKFRAADAAALANQEAAQAAATTARETALNEHIAGQETSLKMTQEALSAAILEKDQQLRRLTNASSQELGFARQVGARLEEELSTLRGEMVSAEGTHMSAVAEHTARANDAQAAAVEEARRQAEAHLAITVQRMQALTVDSVEQARREARDEAEAQHLRAQSVLEADALREHEAERASLQAQTSEAVAEAVVAERTKWEHRLTAKATEHDKVVATHVAHVQEQHEVSLAAARTELSAEAMEAARAASEAAARDVEQAQREARELRQQHEQQVTQSRAEEARLHAETERLTGDAQRLESQLAAALSTAGELKVEVEDGAAAVRAEQAKWFSTKEANAALTERLEALKASTETAAYKARGSGRIRGGEEQAGEGAG